MEQFLPRLDFVGKAVAEAADARYVKWTGDGFLVWSETPLYRQLDERAFVLLNAAWWLSFIVNVTQLGVSPKRRFQVRHGIAYEHDALILRLKNAGDRDSFDLLGRGVVLAFRFAGIPTAFPAVVTQSDVVKAASAYGPIQTQYGRIRFSREDVLRYFKGERCGTGTVYASVDKSRRALSPTTLVRKNRRLLASISRSMEGGDAAAFGPRGLDFARLVAALQAGPLWSQEVYERYHRFMHEMEGTIRELTEALPKN